MKIALLSATKVSLDPIENAFQKLNHDVELFHLLDSSLLPLLKLEKEITPSIIQRFVSLINLAVSSKADAILLTCSAFNNITSILQPLYNIKLFRSDEAMLNLASKYDKIGLVSTVAETPLALETYIKKIKPTIQIESVVDDGIISLLNSGKNREHDQRVKEMIYQLEGIVDAIVLSQYSIAHVKKLVSLNTPIFSAPDASAKLCIKYLQDNKTKEY